MRTAINALTSLVVMLGTSSAFAATAVFAGGCFWSMESTFEKLPGVSEVISGYTGGKKENPSYEEVSSGTTGHVEAVEVTYDPAKISFNELLHAFWMASEPTNPNGQFVDSGEEYRSIIFYGNAQEKKLAEKSRDDLEKSKRFEKKIVTQILPTGKFWKAEDYHQNYYKTNASNYMRYRGHSGREEYLKKYWAKESTQH